MKKGQIYWLLLLHGSGKTAVLVERIIHKIIDDKVDIDKILVVTFTNAAASEMRERILDAIYEKLEQNPEDSNLHRQITLLNKASICTIHSFCLDVIRNNFYEIDTSANFRIGDTAEIELLKNDVLEDLFEKRYEEQDEGFLKLVETYTGYRGDEALAQLILNIYKYIQSSPFPDKWIEEKVEMFNLSEDTDFSTTIWGKIIINDAKNILDESILKLEKAKNDTLRFAEMEKYTATLEQDINNLKYVQNNIENWDKAYYNLLDLKKQWGKWPIDKKVTLDLKNTVKEIRDSVKKQVAKIKITDDSKTVVADIKDMYAILKELQRVVMDFGQAFAEKKKEKNMIDFNDIEHFALKILIKHTENGEEPSEVAKKYRNKFAEIAIDEYQDSNLVQEYILNSISNGKNIFMVGDVKQSIYRFRQARPELFLDKYENYKLKENFEEDGGLKIQLFKNFRSRSNVLDITNLVFEDIMSKDLGDVDYTQEEYLNYGANYPEPEEKYEHYAGIAELNIIDLKENEEKDIYKEDGQSETKADEEEEEQIENVVLEARFTAHRIKEILDSGYMVYDRKKGYRKITYKDICVLLRATSTMAPIYEKEIADLDLPVFSDTSSTYLDSMEVQIIMSLLKIIDNPMQDISLVTVLRSSIYGFTDNELIQIRLADKNSTFYEAMIKAKLVVDEKLKSKIIKVEEELDNWRREEEYLPLDELIWKIYMDTGFYHYVSLLTNGDLRQANLKLLFEKAKQYEKASFKGLFNFINFIDKVKTSSGDMGSAKLIGESENVIRIMSIHKSKGLEFPIVFLCGTGKKFNLQDLNNSILLHQDIGIGPKYIDKDRKIEYNTIAQEAIKIQSKKETISEEMRVLYVALTRAKEKLIITGLSKDLKKSLDEKEQLLEIYKKQGKINFSLVGKYISYLDWIELVYLKNKENIDSVIELNEYKKSKFLKEIHTEEKETVDVQKMLKEHAETEEERKMREQIEEKLKYKYQYLCEREVPTKTSVTKLKQMQEDENEKDIEDLLEESDRVVQLTQIPKFMEEKQKLTPMQKGTLMHLCVQKLDEKQEYSREDIIEFVSKLFEDGIISEIEKQAINIDALYKYTKSDLFVSLKSAKDIYKEQPFYINIPAKDIYDDANDEMILVQGIIDLYYINDKNELILVDYKTDYIPKGKEIDLEEKYRVQLDLYKKALENSLKRKVDKAMIYALS